jgi:putative PIN family toxin of toxin-antitoxin system
MRVVLDTNCFISCIGKKSLYRNVFDAFQNYQYTMCLSTDILFEYEEIFYNKWGEEVTKNLLTRILRATNIITTQVYFDLNLSIDKDDDKFINVFISSNSDCLVSNDSDRLSLRNNSFPPINVITLQAFSIIIKTI